MITRTNTLTLMLFLSLVGRQAFADPLFTYPNARGWAEAEPKAAISVFDELQRDDLLLLTLTTDLAALDAKRKTEDYQTADLSYEVPGMGVVSRDVEVRVRGKYRRRVCDFPPLKLKFPKTALQQAGLNEEHRSLKLVTHCLENEKEGNENVLREYLTYQLYGMITENSYRVQLVRITYQDSGDPSNQLERYGFLIEDTDEMAERLGGKECEDCLNPSVDELSHKEATLMAVFQFMIGNMDWKADMLRNLKLVTIPGQERSILVPYDFDFAGLVNTDYAKPNPDFPTNELRDRVYMGIPVDDPVMKWALNYIKFQRKAIIKHIDNFDLLSRRSRKDITDYINHFYTYLSTMQINKGSNLHYKISKSPLIYSYALPTDNWEEEG